MPNYHYAIDLNWRRTQTQPQPQKNWPTISTDDDDGKKNEIGIFRDPVHE